MISYTEDLIWSDGCFPTLSLSVNSPAGKAFGFYILLCPVECPCLMTLSCNLPMFKMLSGTMSSITEEHSEYFNPPPVMLIVVEWGFIYIKCFLFCSVAVTQCSHGHPLSFISSNLCLES